MTRLIPGILFSLVCLSVAKPKKSTQTPKIVEDGTHIYHIYNGLNGEELKLEAVISFGMDDEQIMGAEQSIVRYYTGDVVTSGVETNNIGDELEKAYGGYWTVGIFDDPYGMAYTVSRRAPMYVVFELNGEAGILIAKQGQPKPSEMKKFGKPEVPMRRRVRRKKF